MPAPEPRPAITALPTYKPGKSAELSAREHGLASAIKLASNENPYDPLPSVREAIDGALSRIGRYADHRATALRAAIAEHEELAPEQVTVGCGSVGLLQQLFLTYVDRGQPVVYGWRSFEAYPIYAATVGAHIVAVPNRFEALDMAGITAAVTPDTRLVMITSPNNPTGTLVRHDELETLLATAPPSCLVVLDEAYYEYITGSHAPKALDLLKRHPNLAVLRTFSKAYGLAGLRVGYLMADPAVIEAVDKTLVPFAVNGMGQVAALASLDADEELGERVNTTIAERDRVASALRGLGFSVPDPEANFVWLPSGEASAALFLKLETHGVVTRPFPGEGVRVTIGTPAENDQFLAAFDAAIEPLELAGHWRLPVGDGARRVQAFVDAIAAIEERIILASLRAYDGLTEPEADGEEQWTAGHVWAHMSEFCEFWPAQARRIVDAASATPVRFGRRLDDDSRVGPIARRHEQPVGDLVSIIVRGLDGMRSFLTGLGPVDWARTGDNPARGAMTIDQILWDLVIGHLSGHLDTLDTLAVVEA